MFPVLTLVGNGNASQNNESLLHTRCGNGLHHVMRGLTKRTIRMCCVVCMNVANLCRGAKQEKNRDEGNQQNSPWRVLHPYLAGPSHS